MKKLVFVGLLASICLVTIGQTQLQRGSDGSIRLEPAESVQYQNLGIVISKEAKEYVSFAKQAIEKKGDTISVGITTEKFLGMKGIFYAKIVKEYSQGIVCDGKVVDCVGSYQGETKVVFALFIIFALISLVLMIISNFLFRKERFSSASAFAPAFATFAFVFAFTPAFASVFAFTYTPAFTFTTLVFAFAFVFATFALALGSKKIYWFFSIIYYILMLIFFILLFV